jgi:hypothetical protein
MTVLQHAEGAAQAAAGHATHHAAPSATLYAHETGAVNIRRTLRQSEALQSYYSVNM